MARGYKTQTFIPGITEAIIQCLACKKATKMSFDNYKKIRLSNGEYMGGYLYEFWRCSGCYEIAPHPERGKYEKKGKMEILKKV